MKTAIVVVFAFAAGFGLHLGLSEINAGPSSIADHWAVVEDYNAYLQDSANYEFDPQTGLSSTTPPPEPLPSLAALEIAGELVHLDIVLATVPQTRVTSRYWMWFLQDRNDIVHARGHYDPSGDAPIHLNLWYKHSARNAVQQLMKDLEEVAAGGIVLTGTGFETRRRNDRLVPAHPNRHRFLGEWESEGEAVLTIVMQPDGSVTIESVDDPDWASVINNVRWEADALHYDQYMYYTGQEDLATIINPLGGHPFSGVRIASVLSLTDDPDRLGHSVSTEATPQPIAVELRRVSANEDADHI